MINKTTLGGSIWIFWGCKTPSYGEALLLNSLHSSLVQTGLLYVDCWLLLVHLVLGAYGREISRTCEGAKPPTVGSPAVGGCLGSIPSGGEVTYWSRFLQQIRESIPLVGPRDGVSNLLGMVFCPKSDGLQPSRITWD